LYAQNKDNDVKLWKKWKETKDPNDLQQLVNTFSGTINTHVNKWSGSVPRSVLDTEAKKHTIKAFETYTPDKGTALNTHVNNQLQPLSRTVYTYQNTARMPENITLKMRTYQTAKEHLTDLKGREPTTDELHQELGWSAPEINRVEQYHRTDLIESAGDVAGNFYSTADDDDQSVLSAVYFDLAPKEKKLFEHTTGYGGARIMNNSELTKELGINQSQLSYKKTLLKNKIDNIMNGKSS